MSRFDRTDRRTFNEVADDYDVARPSYPDAIIHQLATGCGLTSHSRILEIGCGTGQLTGSLAELGSQVTAIDLGPRLADCARRNLRAYPKVSVLTNDFETWQASEEPFDLVISAQAFHWIDPDIGYAKARALLKPTGMLALLWNLFAGGSGPIYEALDRVYRTQAPCLCQGARASLAERVERITAGIITSGTFHPAEIHRVPWTSTYTPDEYIRLLQTFSDHRALEPSMREELFSSIRRIIERHGGRIERPWVATLFLSQPRRMS